MTEMSFVLCNIDLANVIRQDAQIRHHNKLSNTGDFLFLDASYRNLMDDMLVFYQDAAQQVDQESLGLPALVQSWLLRLGVFQK